MKDLFDNDYISVSETASILCIHTASIRNWVRHGYLKPVNTEGRLYFHKNEVEKLKSEIDTGKLERLNKRANKSNARMTFIPAEYLSGPNTTEKLEHIVNVIRDNHLRIETSLLYLAVNILTKHHLINVSFAEDKITEIKSDNPYLEEELNGWISSSQNVQSESYYILFKIDLPDEEDILGLIYQSVTAVGKKSKMGSYYTPADVIYSIMKDYFKPGLTLLDPCCGTGRFLLCASSISDNPETITGFDIDNTAVRIARINLLMKFSDRLFSPQVYCYDTLGNLSDKFKNSFDVIASNPPWGIHFKEDEQGRLKKLYPEVTSGESFSFFIRKGYDILKQGGILSFILPEAILNVKVHKDIRKFILDNCTIISVHLFQRLFQNVFTKVIRLDIKKENSNDNRINVFKKSAVFSVNQSELYKNPNYSFTFYSDDTARVILEKIYSFNHTTLKNQAAWALGIVTGDNQKFLSPSKEEGFEEVFTGKEVTAYKLKPARKYIKFTPELFQQVAPELRYRAKEKLIYKFISKDLVFAYDDHQRLTLNSANILIPEVSNYPIKTILALFNSELYKFIFHQKFRSIKILRSHLEELPLPLWAEDIHKEIVELVNSILYQNQETKEELDNYIFEKFCLTPAEIAYLRR